MEFHEKAIYLIGLLQLASKGVLSGSDCLKIDGGWGFAPDPTGGAYSAHPDSRFQGVLLLREGTQRGLTCHSCLNARTKTKTM